MPRRIDAEGNILDEECGISTNLSDIPQNISGTFVKISWTFWLLLLFFVSMIITSAFFYNQYIAWTVIIAGWVVSLCFHEWAHAFVANIGDPNVGTEYLSLDVRKYSDPLMTFLVPCILLLLGGVPLPGGSVVLQTTNLTRKWKFLTSLAGPFANFIFAAFLSAISNLIIYFISSPTYRLMPFVNPIILLAKFQVLATILNLLPLPPLDGWSAISVFLPDDFPVKTWLARPKLALAITLISLALIFLVVSRSSVFHKVAFGVELIIALPPLLKRFG